MDRQIVYVGAIPQDVDQLKQNRNTMIGLGYALQAILGTGTLVDGLACNPTAPASLSVTVGPGSICSVQNVDGTAYGSLNADTTDNIVKQGIVMSTQTFNCPAPVTSGFSVVYLIEAAYQDVDGGSTVLPYYNASNPSTAYNGPNNTGTSQNTVRQGVCNVQVKTGVAATTGTQVTPSPDAGYTGLYAITVANGQSTVTSGNIVQLSTAPFISPKLPSVISTVQSGSPVYAVDTSGTANTVTISLSPAVSSLTAGMHVRIKMANTNTGAVNINTNGNGNVSAVTTSGNALTAGTLQQNGVYGFTYDGTHWQLQGAGRVPLTANTTFNVATTGNDSTGNGTSGAPWATLQKAANYIQNNIDLAGFTATVQAAAGTYTAGVSLTGPFTGAGGVVFQGDLTTPGNCIVSTTAADAFAGSRGAIFTHQGFKMQTASSGYGVHAFNGGQIYGGGKMEFGSCASGQIQSDVGGLVQVVGIPYTISGGSVVHIGTSSGGKVICTGNTVTLSGTPAFSGQFVASSSAGDVEVYSNTYSGSATGVRYLASGNALINTQGAGSTYLPGNSAGSTSSGGQYV